ncbi:hypothetical protein AB4142_32705, partial [Variovorax sp. 2RAF20]
LALNSQRKQGGGRSNLVTCQVSSAQNAILFGGLSWVDCIVTGVAKPIFTPVLEGANNIADSILPMSGGDKSRNKPPAPLQETDGRPHS